MSASTKKGLSTQDDNNRNSEIGSSKYIAVSDVTLMSMLCSENLDSGAWQKMCLKGPTTGNDTSLLSVRHVRQKDYWDCGIACISMVLNSMNIPKPYATLCSLCGTKSIWTIDLAHLLARCGVPITMTTTFWGANPSYRENRLTYYETFSEDCSRVETLFRKASNAGITILQHSISIEKLIRILCTGKYVVIALVDSHTLSGGHPFSDSKSMVGYAGHYVLLHGWDNVQQSFLVKDPSLGIESRKIRAYQFEAARKFYGTDEDMIFVSIT